MKKTVLTASILLAGVFTTPAVAEEGRGSIGIGSYALNVADNTDTASFFGSAIVAGYKVNDRVSFNGHYYSMDEDSSTSFLTLNATGFDVMARLGHNGLGFNYFAGLGFYSETWDLATGVSSQILASSDFMGGLVGLGVGYNWKHIDFTYEIAMRSTGDYETELQGTNFVTVSGSLNLSYRF